MTVPDLYLVAGQREDGRRGRRRGSGLRGRLVQRCWRLHVLHVLIILLVLVLRWLWYVAGGRSYHHGLSGCGGGWRGWRLWYVARRRRYDWSWRRRWRPGCDAGVCTSIVAAESVARTVGVSHSWAPAVGSLPSALGGGPRPSCRTFWVLYELEGPALGGD